MQKKNFGKYLKYAIGEIVLVVTGILIALSINNWNNARIDRRTEKDFLERLKKDLMADAYYFEKRAKESKKRICNYYRAIDSMYKPNKNWNDLSEIFSLMPFKSNHLTLQDFTFTELTNSGKLNLIVKTKVRDSLVTYYKRADAVAKHVQEANEWSVNSLDTFHANNPQGSYRFEQRSGNRESQKFRLEWLNSPNSSAFRAFEKAIAIYISKNEIFENYFIEMNEKARRLAIMIDSYEQN